MNDAERGEMLCLIAAKGRAYARLVSIASFGAPSELDDRLKTACNAVLALNDYLASSGLIPEEDP